MITCFGFSTGLVRGVGWGGDSDSPLVREGSRCGPTLPSHHWQSHMAK